MPSNENYVKHDENNNPVSPQPGSTQDTSDPGLGWQTTPYKNFNADYVARNADNTPRTPLPYIPRGSDNQIIPKATYVRMDENNNPVVSPGPIQPQPPGQIFAPDGLAVGRNAVVVAAQYTGGVPPIVYEAQLQREPSPGVWEGFTPWVNAIAGIRELSVNEEGMRIRANTRISDRDNPTPIIVPGIPVGPIQPKLELVSLGTLSGSGQVGTILTQTPATFVGGIAPFTFKYQFVRRAVGGKGFLDFAPEGLTYTIQESDLGYEIRGRTIITDAFGVKVNSSTTIPSEIVVIP